MSCSIGVVPCSSFRLPSGVVVGSRCAWSSSGAWSSEWFSGSVCWWQSTTCQDSAHIEPPHSWSTQVPPSCGLTCLRLQKMCLRWWPYIPMLKNPRPSSLIPSFLKLIQRLAFMAGWWFRCVCMCLCKTGFWDWEATNCLAVLQSHLDWKKW